MKKFVILLLLTLSTSALSEELKEFADVKNKAYWDKFYEDGYDHINDFYRYYPPYVFVKKIEEYPKERIIHKEEYEVFCKKYLGKEKECPLPLKMTSWKEPAYLLFELKEKPEQNSKITGFKVFELKDNRKYKNISRYSPTEFSFIVTGGRILTPTALIQDSGTSDESTNWDHLTEDDRSWAYENILDYKIVKNEKGINEEWMRFSSMGNKISLWLSSEEFKYFKRPGLGTKDQVNWGFDNVRINGLYSLQDVRYFSGIFINPPLCFDGIQNGEIAFKKFLIPPPENGHEDRKEYSEKISSLQLFFQDILKYKDKIYKFTIHQALESGKWNPSKISFLLDHHGFEKPPEVERNCEGREFVRDMPSIEKEKFYKKYCSLLFPNYCSDYQIKKGIQSEHFKKIISSEEVSPMDRLQSSN